MTFKLFSKLNRKSPSILAVTCILSCILSMQPASGSNTAETIPFVGTHQVNRYVLDNGLTLLVVEDHSSPTLAYQTWFKVGSRNEVPSRTGLAHLFEHMMFKETKNLKDGEFDHTLESAGAEGENAFTSRDFTAYIQEMPKDKLDLIARLEAERMVNLVINEKAYNTEREVVQNERRFRNENSPDGMMNQELFNLAFQKHSYHWPVIGYEKDLAAMSVSDATAFYKSYYSPNHATVVVVGDVKADEVLKIVKKHYGELKASATPSHVIQTEPPVVKPRRKELKLNIQVEKLVMGFPIPGITHADIPALDVLQSILSGGKSSRLHHALVDSGIATSVGSDDLGNIDPTLFVFYANLQKGKRAKQAETVILSELEKLAKTRVTPEELERAKNKLSFSFFGSLESNYEKAEFLGQYQTITGNFLSGIDNHKQIQKVTAEAVQAAAKAYFKPQSRIVITGVKK